MNIILTGFMMSGKTSIGSELAKMLGYRFIDTDKMIEREERLAVKDIFAKYGEEYFRNKETEAAEKISELDKCVAATGGGMVLRECNMELLRKNGYIVNLKITPEIIRERMDSGRSDRPLIKDADFSEIVEKFKKRERFYDACDYTVVIEGEKSPRLYAEEIAEYLKREVI